MCVFTSQSILCFQFNLLVLNIELQIKCSLALEVIHQRKQVGLKRIELWHFVFISSFSLPTKTTDHSLVNPVEQESVSASLVLVMSDAFDKG